jgi:hypothetical protein
MRFMMIGLNSSTASEVQTRADLWNAFDASNRTRRLSSRLGRDSAAEPLRGLQSVPNSEQEIPERETEVISRSCGRDSETVVDQRLKTHSALVARALHKDASSTH